MMHNWGLPSFFHSYKFVEGCWCEYRKVCFDAMLTIGEKYYVGLIWLTLQPVLLYSNFIMHITNILSKGLNQNFK